MREELLWNLGFAAVCIVLPLLVSRRCRLIVWDTFRYPNRSGMMIRIGGEWQMFHLRPEPALNGGAYFRGRWIRREYEPVQDENGEWFEREVLDNG